MSAPLVIALDAAADPALAGGKAATLARLRAAGLPAPDGLVVTTAAYRAFVTNAGLGERIALELSRRPLAALRAEETFDVALRIRALVLAAPWPAALRCTLESALAPLANAGPLAIRSSAPHEDGRRASFAGLHESVLGVGGVRDALDAIRSVWASLFSDRALLYGAELELDATTSAMAVLIQPLVAAERAGVVFTVSPDDASTGLIEAVWGLGEGLVGARIGPDAWSIARADGRILAHRPGDRSRAIVPAAGGTAERPLETERAGRPPLAEEEVRGVWELARRAEAVLGAPADVEWAVAPDAGLVLVQARPITTRPHDARAAYLEEQRPLEALEALRRDIEERILPGMRAEADAFCARDLARLSDAALAEEALRRAEAVRHWREEYRAALIPFAHGARILGRLYTDALRPNDPFEYLALLIRTPEEYAVHRALLAELGVTAPPAPDGAPRERERAERRFLAAFADPEARERARRVLEVARASWRLRDDDNLYLARVEREAERAAREVRERLARARPSDPAAGGLRTALAELDALAQGSLDSNRPQEPRSSAVRPRQLLGQPAGPGVGRGIARILRSRADLARIDRGAVVVADALEPETAAYAARAAGIVERRGGMLVHGAIVAREHGVPCVTGVEDATALIREGEHVTVDGYLGIVVLEDV